MKVHIVFFSSPRHQSSHSQKMTWVSNHRNETHGSFWFWGVQAYLLMLCVWKTKEILYTFRKASCLRTRGSKHLLKRYDWKTRNRHCQRMMVLWMFVHHRNENLIASAIDDAIFRRLAIRPLGSLLVYNHLHSP